MLRHYLIASLRNLRRKKLYAFINIFGLSIGLALCLIIMSNIRYELSFENIHANKDRIVRVQGTYTHEDEHYRSAPVMAPLGEALAEQIDDVEAAAVFRLKTLKNITIDRQRLRIIDEYEGAGYAHRKTITFAKPDFTRVFTFPLISGNVQTALTDPNSVLITKRAAELYFPDMDPVGRRMIFNDKYDCVVSGILEDIPQNTQLYTDFIVSYSTLEASGEDVSSWIEFSTDYTYLLLREGTEPKTIEPAIAAVARSNIPPDYVDRYEFSVNPLGDIYFTTLGSNTYYELHPVGETEVIYGYGFIALFVLILAIANFINLFTARSADRMKEVGVRQVIGANRTGLMKQYLGEAVVITSIAMVFSILLFEIFVVYAQPVMPREMFARLFSDPAMIVGAILLTVLVGVGAGFYPALYLSRLRPIAILQGKARIGSTKSFLRRALVVFQFGIAALFIFCSLIVARQSSYISSIDHGFDSSNVMVIDFDGDDAAQKCALFKNEMAASSNVLAVSSADSPPGRATHRRRAFYTDAERTDSSRVVVKGIHVDNDFLEMYDLKLVAGQTFEGIDRSLIANPIIVTESTADLLKTDDMLGRHLFGSESSYQIVGIVKDFHATPLKFDYKAAVVLMPGDDNVTSLAMRLSENDIAGAITSTKAAWDRLWPGDQFLYTFLDDEIAESYEELTSQTKIFTTLTGLAIIIACMGIFGLVSFTAERRTKEIGIRKVLGASVSGLVRLLSREFAVLVLIANCIGLPLGYLLMQDFLKWFPFKVTIGPGSFAFVIGLGMLFALGTAGYQSLRAARTNPVETLKYE